MRSTPTILAVAIVLVLTVSSGVGQDFDAHPLRPPDTSSPRATLRSFLESADRAWEGMRSGDFEEGRSARASAIQTLDFSETPNGVEWEERSKRIIYLKEILDRIPLPPFEEIPGDAEVGEGGLRKWTIPDTRISIARVDEGERAGDWLFTAGSVARLHRYYRQVAHLPYKPGASGGFLESYVRGGEAEGTAASRMRSRLRPLEAASPRALLQQFLASVNAVSALITEAQAGLRSRPPSLTRAQAVELDRRAGILMDRAVATLDLSAVSDALREDVGVETAMLLKEILDRAPLPPIESVPGARTVTLLRQAGKGPIRWRFPNTEIEIVELLEGPQAGEFRFSADTVARADEFYARVRDLPYRGSGRGAGARAEYDSPEVSRGLHDYYVSTPGHLVPGASWLGPLLVGLPEPLKALYLEQTAWQWLGIALGVIVALVAWLLVRAGARRAARLASPVSAAWIGMLLPALGAAIVVRLVEFIDRDLNVTGAVLAIVLGAGTALVYVFAALAALRFCVAVSETIVRSPRIAEEGFDASLARLGGRVVGFLAAVVLVFTGVRELGADVVPLLAGLGVGGLAVALAVRPTLENMIGGVILYADRPIAVGDYCTFGGQSGIVEGIGLRSTRIRGLDRSLISVPNAAFADMQLVNWARCDKMLIRTLIALRYETTPEQLRHVLAQMRQLCLAHPKIETESLRVRFSGFGASSLDVAVRVYALTNEWNEYHAIREDLFLRFMEIIDESGTSVAFPSTTVYLGRDEGLDPSRIEASEREVEAWRAAHELPFPSTPEALASRITDTLDYPPRGSPETVGKEVTQASEERLTSAEEEGPRDDGSPPARGR